MNKYKYEVAFSFLKEDETIAYELNDLLQDRMSTFIYSKKQEELSGTDGEKKFNQVFNQESRIVVVLYRNNWGKTAWTRIEETAIKNRAFDSGWDFLLLINLDSTSTLPKWIPKTIIWHDYDRFKLEGAVAVIEYKIKESGGETRPESIEDRAERLKRKRNLETERNNFLKSYAAFTTACEELSRAINSLKEIKPKIEDPSTYLHLATSERQFPPMYEFGYRNYFLCFNNRRPFDHEAKILEVIFYQKFERSETIHKQWSLKFDRDLAGNNGWSDSNTGKDFMTTDELINKMVKKFIDDIGKFK